MFGVQISSADTWEEEVWLALAAVTLATAIGFSVLALTVQDFKF
jgi:hypothetical protein